jgi:DNA (cytosine-5)-methyltransferase 1
MKYLSVCSGIEAASKAWKPIGWKPVAFSEIEPFPSAVLKHHWPEVPNLGDMSKYEQWNIQSGSVDLLVGGTPCQSFSVAGLRQGLKDPRGNLMLTYLAIAERLKPRWLVWENVPGVLSSNGGKDFGSFLGALGELGYEWAYRVLDAQWFGVAQRRRRVFVVAHLGEGSLAAKVLFESESVRRDTPPSRETRQGVATNVEAGVGGSKGVGAFRMQAFGEYANDGTASAMKARAYKDATDLVASPVVIDRAAFNQGQNAQYKPRIEHGETMDSLVARGPHAVAIPIHDQATRNAGKRGDKQDGKGNGLGVGKPGDPAPTLTKGDKHAVLYENHPNDSRVTGPHDVAPSCVSRYGTGGGNVPLVQEAVSMRESGQGYWMEDNKAGTLRAEGENRPSRPSNVIAEPVAVDTYNHALQEKAVPIRSTASDVCHTGGVINPADRMAVRRLTPRECERLQGFNDDHTMIPWRNKPADQCPDGPRYKALGNSMAVPCMAWIGKRIDAVEKAK